MLVAMYICIFLEFITVPFFIRWGWPQLTVKSFFIKAACSFLFIIFGIVATLEYSKINLTSAVTSYQMNIIVGLLLGFFGDILLCCEPFFKNNKPFNTAASLLGGFAFLAGHIFYIIAFMTQQDGVVLPYTTLFWILFASLLGVSVALKFILKVKLGKMTVPVILYTLVIDLMFSSAVTLSFTYGKPVIIILLTLGSGLFVVSDMNLALKIFEPDRFHTLPNRCIYVITYYIAQFLIASSMLFM